MDLPNHLVISKEMELKNLNFYQRIRVNETTFRMLTVYGHKVESNNNGKSTKIIK